MCDEDEGRPFDDLPAEPIFRRSESYETLLVVGLSNSDDSGLLAVLGLIGAIKPVVGLGVLGLLGLIGLMELIGLLEFFGFMRPDGLFGLFGLCTDWLMFSAGSMNLSVAFRESGRGFSESRFRPPGALCSGSGSFLNSMVSKRFLKVDCAAKCNGLLHPLNLVVLLKKIRRDWDRVMSNSDQQQRVGGSSALISQMRIADKRVVDVT